MTSSHQNAHRVHRFGQFALDLDRETLIRRDGEVHLRPKAFAVLKLLIEQQGKLVTKKALHDAVWGKAIVTDGSLAHCTADIRKALGSQGFDIVRTVPRRGYVLDPPGAKELERPPLPGIARLRRAVPFRAWPAALVLAMSFVWSFAGRGDSHRVDLNSVDVADDAAAVIAVHRPLVNSRDTASADSTRAWNEYLKGRFFYDRREAGDIDRAETIYRTALELDPSLGEAWSGLAAVYNIRFGDGSSDGPRNDPAVLASIDDATQRAIALTPDSAEAHIRRASYHRLNGEWKIAGQHFHTALALAPNDPLVLGVSAGMAAHAGQLHDAVELQTWAVEASPLSIVGHHNLVFYLLAAGRFEEAAVQAEQYTALKPAAGDESLLADVLILQREYEQALERVHGLDDGSKKNSALTVIYHALGQTSQADAALARLMADGDEDANFHRAEVFAHRGDTNQAMHWLTRAVVFEGQGKPTDRDHHKVNVALLSPYLISLRGDSRWQALHAQVLNARGIPRLVAAVNDR